MITVIHPTGNPNVRGLLAGLLRHDLLSGYYTTFGVARDERWPNLLPSSFKEQVLRRRYDLPQQLLHTRPGREIFRLLRGRSGLSKGNSKRPSVDNVYFDLDRYVATRIRRSRLSADNKAVYGYEDGSLDTFYAARDCGWKNFYELPIGYWRAGHELFKEEAELQPEWAPTLPALNEPQHKLDRKDEELKLADRIYVASRYTLKTLEAAPFDAAPVEVIPYGSPLRQTPDLSSNRPEGKLRVLFVGGLSQRKGLSYLFEATRSLQDRVELTVIGRLTTSSCKPLEDCLQRHHWIESLPHYKVLECMVRHDVLVFPSLFEGFGLVILEALGQGLPVITTSHTVGPDVITEGEDGFIVPVRSSTAIEEKLLMLSSEPERLVAMKENALKKSAQFTWQRYEDNIAASLQAAMRNT